MRNFDNCVISGGIGGYGGGNEFGGRIGIGDRLSLSFVKNGIGGIMGGGGGILFSIMKGGGGGMIGEFGIIFFFGCCEKSF